MAEWMVKFYTKGWVHLKIPEATLLADCATTNTVADLPEHSRTSTFGSNDDDAEGIHITTKLRECSGRNKAVEQQEVICFNFQPEVFADLQRST